MVWLVGCNLRHSTEQSAFSCRVQDRIRNLFLFLDHRSIISTSFSSYPAYVNFV